MRLLVIENDKTLNHLIVKSLEEEGYKSDFAFNVIDGEYFLNVRNYNLVIVDTSFGLSEVFKFIDYAKSKVPLIKIIVISDDERVES